MDSRLPDGFYFVKMKVKKKDYQPIEQFKIGAGMGKMMGMKKLIGSRFSAMTKNKLALNFKLR